MHAGFIFLADSSHALIVGFCVRLTAQSVGLQLWGSAGSWSANIVAHCKDSSNWVMVAVLYHELESLRLAWMHWRAHASWGRELAAVECVGSMLTLKASMAPWCATGTHCPWQACARADLWMVCWYKRAWEVAAWFLTVAEFWLKGHGAVGVGMQQCWWKQQILKTKKCGAAYQCNSKSVHSCHTKYYMCAQLQDAYCFLLNFGCVCAVPFAHCSINFATPCVHTGWCQSAAWVLHPHTSQLQYQPAIPMPHKNKSVTSWKCDQSKSVTNTPECSLRCKRCCDSVYEIATACLACRSGNRHMS